MQWVNIITSRANWMHNLRMHRSLQMHIADHQEVMVHWRVKKNYVCSKSHRHHAFLNNYKLATCIFSDNITLLKSLSNQVSSIISETNGDRLDNEISLMKLEATNIQLSLNIKPNEKIALNIHQLSSEINKFSFDKIVIVNEHEESIRNSDKRCNQILKEIFKERESKFLAQNHKKVQSKFHNGFLSNTTTFISRRLHFRYNLI